MISTITASEISMAATDPVTTAATANFMNYSEILVVALIVAMVLKEIFRSDAPVNNKISNFINGSSVFVIPFLFIFLFVVVYNMAY
jgi:hypothetical protein